MKDKEKSNKGRYLSPSFRKGMVKDKKEEKDDDDGDFKINLIKADDDEEDEKEDSKSPSKNKRKSTKDAKDKKEHKHRGSTQLVPEDLKVAALATGRVKSIASQSQAGKG